MSRNFYRKNKQTEPNMRYEFDAMMDGEYPEISKARPFLLRKMRREDTQPINLFTGKNQTPSYFVPGEGYLQPCGCIDKLTGEPDIDTYCSNCQGEGWLWDEVLIDGYKIDIKSTVGLSTKEELNPFGLVNIPLVVWYTRSSVSITQADKIVELWLDETGSIVQPARRKQLYRIGTPVDFRSDNGKLEYWKLPSFAEQRKFLNGPEVG